MHSLLLILLLAQSSPQLLQPSVVGPRIQAKPQRQADSSAQDQSTRAPLITVNANLSTRESQRQPPTLPASETRGGPWADWTLVVLTFGLLSVAAMQLRSYETGLTHTKVVERAYMSLEAAVVCGKPVNTKFIHVQISLLNIGKTPGVITRIAINVDQQEPAPGPPDYSKAKVTISKMPAVMKDSIVVNRIFDVSLSEAEWGQLLRHENGSGLWLTGRIEYEDRFGDSHAMGFVRRAALEGESVLFCFTEEHQQYEYYE